MPTAPAHRFHPCGPMDDRLQGTSGPCSTSKLCLCARISDGDQNVLSAQNNGGHFNYLVRIPFGAPETIMVARHGFKRRDPNPPHASRAATIECASVNTEGKAIATGASKSLRGLPRLTERRGEPVCARRGGLSALQTVVKCSWDGRPQGPLLWIRSPSRGGRGVGPAINCRLRPNWSVAPSRVVVLTPSSDTAPWARGRRRNGEGAWCCGQLILLWRWAHDRRRRRAERRDLSNRLGLGVMSCLRGQASRETAISRPFARKIGDRPPKRRVLWVREPQVSVSVPASLE
jgi:hypothetical protein